MEHVKDRLSALMDGQLPRLEEAAVKEHLAECDACRRELEYLRAVSRLVAELPKKPLPVGFMERLKRKAQAPGGAYAPWTSRSFLDIFSLPLQVRVAAGAMACLLVTLVVYRGASRKDQVMSSISGAATQVAPVSAPEPGPSFSGGLTRDRMEMTEQVIPAKKAELQSKIVDDKRGDAPSSNYYPHPTLSLKGEGLGITSNQGRMARSASKRELKVRVETPASVPPAPQAAGVSVKMDQAQGMVVNRRFYDSAVPGRAGAKALSSSGLAKKKEAIVSSGAVIKTPEDLSRIWSGLSTENKAPVADFNRQMIVLVNAGPRPSGYKVEIVSVRRERSRLVVRYREIHPNSTGPTAPTRTVFQFKIVPKSNLPVVFQRNP